MKYSGIALKIAVVCTFYVSATHPIGAEEGTRTEDSWTALPDDQSEDTSRGAAFAEHEVAAYDAAAPASSAEPLAIPSQFTFPDDARYDRIEKHDRMNSIFGIDVSHYTDSRLNLDDLKVKNVRFVYIKATQGTSSKDAKFAQFWDGMGKLDPAVKVPRGAYHFLSSTSPGKPQADAFVDYITLHGGIKTGDLPPVVDLEWDVTKKNLISGSATLPMKLLPRPWPASKKLRRERIDAPFYTPPSPGGPTRRSPCRGSPHSRTIRFGSRTTIRNAS